MIKRKEEKLKKMEKLKRREIIHLFFHFLFPLCYCPLYSLIYEYPTNRVCKDYTLATLGRSTPKSTAWTALNSFQESSTIRPSTSLYFKKENDKKRREIEKNVKIKNVAEVSK